MSSSDALVVGVDAGASHVAAVAIRRGQIVGRASGGGTNLTIRGSDAVASAIASAVRAAAGKDFEVVAALFVGAAGAGRRAAAIALARALRDRFPMAEHVTVEDDARIALRAAITEGSGVVLIAGTGSVAYAENGDARVRVGGAGYLLGDEGSAFAIGMSALRSLVRAYEGRAAMDDMGRFVERSLGIQSRDALLDAVYAEARAGRLDVAGIASLARGIVALAGEGNAQANEIVKAAADDLSRLAEDAIRIAGLHNPRLVLAGGLLREQNALAAALAAAVDRRIEGVRVVPMLVEPETAASRLASEEWLAAMPA